MAYVSFEKFWHSKIYNIVSAKDIVQDVNLNQLKLKLTDN